jgi:hypothetical protein
MGECGSGSFNRFSAGHPMPTFASIRGDHHIFSRTGVEEILNLQPRGSLAKPYPVKQVRAVIVRYKLAEGIE